MSVYFDTSVIVPLFAVDAFVARARAFLATYPTDVFVSEFAVAEFASVIGMRCRMKALTLEEGHKVLVNFDTWRARKTLTAETLPSDIRAAEAILRRLDLNLRTPDAIHIATTQRLGAALATFDARMAESAEALGVKTVVM